MKYFDYTATTPIDEEILDTYIKIQKTFFANTTSLHKLGQESNYMYEKAKSELKEILNLKKQEIVFTSNATEANNLAIYGVVKQYLKGRIITTMIEHPSVYEVFRALAEEGYDVVFLSVDEKGIIDLNQLSNALSKDTLLVSVMWVNNIVGSIQPIEEVIRLMKHYPRAKLHVDIVQGLCKIKPNFLFSDIDLLTFSTHKIYGPKGIGALIYKESITLHKRLYGSISQFGVKPGTFDLALVVATVKAVKKFYPQIEEHYQYVKGLNQLLRANFQKNASIVMHSYEEGSPYILNISIPNINGETLVHQLEEKQIYVSTGSSCSSKLKKPEKTIFQMTKSEVFATSTLRISLSHLVRKEDVEVLIAAVQNIIFEQHNKKNKKGENNV